MGRKTTRTYFQDDEIIISRADGTQTRIAIDSMNNATEGQAAVNHLGHLIDTVDATVEDIRSRQRVQTGFNNQVCRSVEDRLESLEGEVQYLRGQNQFLISVIRATHAKIDTDFAAQNAAVTSSQLDEDYDAVWGT